MKLLSPPKELIMDAIPNTEHVHVPWNKGKLTGQKPPLKLEETRAIRILFN
jgi:hypothetical protein